jgi:hypothetical protein
MQLRKLVSKILKGKKRSTEIVNLKPNGSWKPVKIGKMNCKKINKKRINKKKKRDQSECLKQNPSVIRSSSLTVVINLYGFLKILKITILIIEYHNDVKRRPVQIKEKRRCHLLQLATDN